MHRAIAAPYAWKGADLANKTDWIRPFSPGEIAELDAALQSVKQRGLALLDITREDFPLPRFASALAQIAQELETGRGMILLRGLPLEYSRDDLCMIYWGIGAHLGTAVSQGGSGELLAKYAMPGWKSRPPSGVVPKPPVSCRFTRTAVTS